MKARIRVIIFRTAWSMTSPTITSSQPYRTSVIAAARDASVTQTLLLVRSGEVVARGPLLRRGRVEFMKFDVFYEMVSSATLKAGYSDFYIDVLQVPVPVGQYHGTFVITGFIGMQVAKHRLDLVNGLSF